MVVNSTGRPDVWKGGSTAWTCGSEGATQGLGDLDEPGGAAVSAKPVVAVTKVEPLVLLVRKKERMF